MRQERIDWINRTNTFEDPICQKNCLDVCVAYNNRVSSFKELSETTTVLRQFKIIKVETPESVNYYAVIMIYVTNQDTNDTKLKIIEIIPKEFSETASMLTSNLEFEVLNEDPIVVFILDVAKNETMSVSYALGESITKEDADNMIENGMIHKFSGVPILLISSTEINSDTFSEGAIEEPSAFTMFANLVNSEYVLLGFGLLILAAVALFVVNYMRSGQGDESDEGFSDRFGLGAAYRKADNGGFGSSGSRHSEFLSDLAGKIRQNKTEDKNNRWAYED